MLTIRWKLNSNGNRKSDSGMKTNESKTREKKKEKKTIHHRGHCCHFVVDSTSQELYTTVFSRWSSTGMDSYSPPITSSGQIPFNPHNTPRGETPPPPNHLYHSYLPCLPPPGLTPILFLPVALILRVDNPNLISWY